jgi:hypothetical protein
MNAKPSILHRFCEFTLFLILFGGCGWSVIWYTIEPYPMRLNTAGLEVEVWWTDSNDQINTGEYRFAQYRGQPRDSLIVLTVLVFAPRDTSFTPQYLERQIEINHFWLSIVPVDTAVEIARCSDTVIKPGSIWQGQSYPKPVRAILFGPIPVSWPPPETINGSFVLITKDPDTGQESTRDRVQFVARRETKSMLRDFFDGR